MNFKGKGGDFEKPQLGSFAAICYRVIDLGTQDVVWQGKKKRQHKVMITWELDQKMKDGRPFSISKNYTVSLAENASLRKDLETWRGKKFSTEEAENFNEKAILGKPCLISLVMSEDGQYVNVGSVNTIPAGLPVPKQVNPSVFLGLTQEEFSQAVFDALGDKVKAKIMGSPEWAALKGGAAEHVSDEAPAEEVPF